MNRFLPKNQGQVLITVLIAISIFAILSHAVFSLILYSYRLNTYNRSRITARHLAQEKLELIRNLAYDDVGTQGGIPSGSIPQNETITRNEIDFEVRTTIIYIDDEFDQTAPADLLPVDYKRARVEVSWQGLSSSRNSPIVLMTDIAPKGVETTEGGGTLSILVFDAEGTPVPQAEVNIVADSASPPVNITLLTSENGRIILPGAPECISCYEISITKEDYNSERTYSDSEVANPNKPHQTVLENELTEISFAIDRVSTLTIQTYSDRSSGFIPLGNVSIDMQGQKTIGTDSSGEPVYKNSTNYTTDGSGRIDITDIEWDLYVVTLPEASAYNISGSTPFIPIEVNPDTAVELSMSLAPVSANSLLLNFTDPSDAPIASVSASLSDGLGYQETIPSGAEGNPDFGNTFFPDLNTSDYDLTATASGYLDFSSTITVNGISKETIILIPE